MRAVGCNCLVYVNWKGIMLPSYIQDSRASKEEYYYGRTYEKLDEVEKLLIDNKDKVVILCESNDPCADYSYDDYALLELNGYYFVINTSGCSCPSPSETWYVVMHGPKEHIVDLLSRDYDPRRDYSSSGYKEFQREIHKVWPEVPSPPEEKRYDW